MRRPGSMLGLLVILAILELADSNRCLTMLQEVNPKRIVHMDSQSLAIPFELTKRPTQRLATRIMRIFLIEVLGYPGITLREKDDHFDARTVFSRMSEPWTKAVNRVPPETMVNMEVWIPPQEDTMPLLNYYDVKECGSITNPGRFGWFVPERLNNPDDSWRTFARQETATKFDVDDANLRKIRDYTIDPTTNQHYCREKFCTNGFYVPPQCQSLPPKNQPCALLLAENSDHTYFVRDHIDQLKLYVKVAWIGPNLRTIVKSLTKEYLQISRNNNETIVTNDQTKSLVILHWTPSTVIPNDREFVSLEFPRCGNRAQEIGCHYESNRLVKLGWSMLESIAKFAWRAINRANFNADMYEDLIDRYNRMIKLNATEDDVACDWLKDNLNYTLTKWMPGNSDKIDLIVGGIFPITGHLYSAASIASAAIMARDAINSNNTVLRDYNVTMLLNDGQCKSDMVMKSFIDYIAHNYYKNMVGVLGPACSETVEPLVGVSKHYRTVIISYSAEGSSFNDRKKYPYFFRTIGENKQYKHVYPQLLKRFGWKRVAALTEDGQKYTEYISYMQEILRDNGINFIANVKFPRERENNEMTKYLLDLKQKRARIIIADIYDEVARQVMCEAYKLEMTASQGYVWFLPLWLRPHWWDTDSYNLGGENVACTTVEMSRAINGHFGLSHAYFAPDNDIMQENITVREWRARYEHQCKVKNQQPSNYAGYAYDAMWTYAYAMNTLLKENQSYIFDLHSNHTVNRLTDIIASTDFNGVSGRIKFVGGPSRISVITIVQNIDNETRTIGNFYPNISEVRNEIVGGFLDLNDSAIVWLTGVAPDDGSEPPIRCVLAGLSELLDVSCEVAIIVANIIGFGLLGAVLIIGFIIVKRKYDEKVREHEKVMESFGLDPRQTTSGLDKWEIPRDQVVINRKLGEGAFGTVYGGEAFFPEKGWLAVAVKTLKGGSSTEEKLDFLSEVEVMKRFEHKNIIKLLGVCIKCAPVLTVMEFMLYGDLKTYLLARRHLVNDHSYEDADEISNKKLTAMALDVARALSYLAQLKYVHRDVASRNCLVNASRVVKLGDFGMTRPMYENDYYKFNRKGMLPVRWMAPESLGLGIFTPASDVWSYGVLLYEIITFGSFPFQGMSNNEVLTYVKSGNSLVVPKGVKPQLEGLIRSCWTVDHTHRPTAPEIVDFLATNPRVLCPCLDVPLASVQLENSGQMDFQLPESLRKFSMSLNWQPQQQIRQNGNSPLAAFANVDTTNAHLLDINPDQEINNTNLDALLSVRHCDQDISLPLLPNSESRISQLTSNSRTSLNREIFPKYVNLQPGEVMKALSSEIQMNEVDETFDVAKNKKSDDNTFL